MIKLIFLRIYDLIFGRKRTLSFLGVKCGKNCRILTLNFGSEPWLIEIGDNVTITNRVTILTHDGATWLIKDEKGRRFDYRKVIIGNNVFIGTQSIIMPGVEIGNNVIVGAGSVVTKSIPSNLIIGGNPAKKIGYYDEYKAKCLLYPTEYQKYGSNYREKILSILNTTKKKYL